MLDLYPLVILTKIDEVCPDTREDTSKAFHSQIIGDLVRLPCLGVSQDSLYHLI